MRKRILKWGLMVAALGILLSNTELNVKAEERPQTAGSSLVQEKECYAEHQNVRVVPGWRGDYENGWWYQDSDGGWPARSWRKIDGQWYYFDASGYWVDNNTYEAGSIKGIDVSAWQGQIDWQRVKNDGIEFAFIRIGHGAHVLDKYYQQNMAAANAVDLPVGVYFYSTAQTESDALLDAQFVIANMQGYKVSYPVVIDLEDNSQQNLSKEQIGRIAKVYCDEIRKAGYTPMLYCNEWWYQSWIDVSQIEDVEKWVARYDNVYTESIPRGIWQCCCTGRVDGIQGNVDIDFGYKDYTEIVTPRTSFIDGYEYSSNRWVKDAKGWWYSYGWGSYPANQWEKIQGIWYWFDADGYMATGWRKIGSAWYYMSGSGAMQTGWQYINGQWYYMSSSGAMLTGWQYINGQWYYMSSSGAMLTGWQYINGQWYYMSSSGAMLTGWQWIGNQWYFLNASGAWVPA